VIEELPLAGQNRAGFKALNGLLGRKTWLGYLFNSRF
jgi:hypothetical protein